MALIVDMFVVFMAWVLMIMVVELIYNGDSAVLKLLLLAVTLLSILYIPLCEGFNNGQTVGKIVMSTRVVRTDGMPITFVHSLQRYLMMYVDLPLTFGVGALLSTNITKRRQRLGDIVADTMVVHTSPHNAAYWQANMNYNNFTPDEQAYFRSYCIPPRPGKGNEPTEMARFYRGIQSALVRERTIKGHPKLIEMLESVLGVTHMRLFSHKAYTLADIIKFTLNSIPRAVYESRHAICGAVLIAAIGFIIGVYSQCADPGFFRDFMGGAYTDMTLDNIQSGNPMGVYGMQNEFDMLFNIFVNNLRVTLRLYASGVVVLFGPMYILLINFVMDGTFNTFFAQHGVLGAALLTVNEHGTLELWSIIMTGGAALRLGTGWLFPGRLSRIKALAISARQSVLILISTLPMLFLAAIIESFITRHTEWPLAARCLIVVVSSVFILFYYVMLPIIARHK